MSLASRKLVKDLLKQYGLRPSKRLGQHFLVDKGVLQDIIAAAELNKNDIVLEIGPGIGTLTTELVGQVKKVIAVEKDTNMVKILRETLGDTGNVEIVPGDILKAGSSSMAKWLNGSKNYKVVANLPYYLTSPVIRRFLEAKRPPPKMVLLVQKEVAQRICAKPPKMNLLAVSVQFYAKPKIIRYVKKTSFWPQPKVDSAIIKMVPDDQALNKLSARLRERFFQIVRSGFSQPRKQLINNLSRGLKMDRVGLWEMLTRNDINPTARAENLTLKNWITLTKVLELR